MNLATKSLVCLSLLFASCAVEAALGSPYHVAALTPTEPEPRTEVAYASHIREAKLEVMTTITMPALDIKANRPHKPARKVGRLVCDEPHAMVGVPGGAPHAAYGRVVRCEVM